jgi:hypothetical protein
MALLALLQLGLIQGLPAEDYHVGQEQPLASIGSVPWGDLKPGDRVLIHWRPEPYREKWVVCCQGTPSEPIAISGVPGPEGQLPVINGDGARTDPALNYWAEERGVVKIGGSNRPADLMPKHLVVEHLEIRGGRRPYSFTGRNGLSQYSKAASAIFVEKAEDLTLRGLVLHDCSNGLVVSHQSRDVTIEGCHIHGNGNEGSPMEHNVYTESLGLTFQFNRLGPLREGSRGNNFKDRSAGMVVRYNWIEGGNRQLDLVDCVDNTAISTSPRYRDSWVYGNTLIEPEDGGNNQLVNYGGDSGQTEHYRKGTLHFWHNTIVTSRSGPTVLFRFFTADERVDCRNNIFFASDPRGHIVPRVGEGRIAFGRNWISKEWQPTSEGEDPSLPGVIGVENLIEGIDPGFEPEAFTLATDSQCSGSAEVIPDSLADVHRVDLRYVPHQQSEEVGGTVQVNLGAY